jgi:hypothetical protein
LDDFLKCDYFKVTLVNLLYILLSKNPEIISSDNADLSKSKGLSSHSKAKVGLKPAAKVEDILSMPVTFPPSVKRPLETDPRWDDYAFGLKSGVNVAVDKTPIQFLTFLSRVKHVWLFGDGKINVGNHKMEDVATGSFQRASESLQATGMLQYARTPYKRQSKSTLQIRNLFTNMPIAHTQSYVITPCL